MYTHKIYIVLLVHTNRTFLGKSFAKKFSKRRRMAKQKVAIAIDSGLLKHIDSKAENLFSSRSQAIEHFLRKGLQDELIKNAVLMLKGDHQEYSLKNVGGKSLLWNQIAFLKKYGLKDIHIVTQKSDRELFNRFVKEVAGVKKKEHVNISVHVKNVKGNAEALYSIKQWLNETFVAMSGDLHIDFNLRNMTKKHLDFAKVAVMGLMMRDIPAKFGNAVLDGDFIVDFVEKPKKAKSYAVNAGIYVFTQGIFDYLKSAVSLERDVFPKLASSEQLVGHFAKGDYRHMEE